MVAQRTWAPSRRSPPPAGPAATAVYVDGRNGRDTNSGTAEAPLRAIARASELLRDRDTTTSIVKLLPGLHMVDRAVSLRTEKATASGAELRAGLFK